MKRVIYRDILDSKNVSQREIDIKDHWIKNKSVLRCQTTVKSSQIK